MAIAKDKKVYTKAEQQVMNRFEEAFNKILNQSYDYENGVNYVADYLRELDAKSYTTFNHSVRVAANVFRELSNDKSFSRKDVLDYTRAALLHDVGKLTTKLNDPPKMVHRSTVGNENIPDWKSSSSFDVYYKNTKNGYKEYIPD
jgi:response regulator RpfG family c-di-GMP phosphodiesterase